MIKRITLVLSVMATVIVMQALVGAPPARALGTTPDDTWMTNGKVYATALSEDGSTLYIGGKFTRVTENPPGETGRVCRVSNLAAIDVATGTAELCAWKPSVTGDGAVVRSLAVEGGRVFIGGNFTAVDGEPRKNLAAVDAADGDAADGSVDPFAPQVGGATSNVYALLADESKLYIGGAFNKVDGQSRSRLAAFDLATGALDPEWRPTANSSVRDLEFASDGTSIFVAGGFSSMMGSDGTEDGRQSVGRVYADTGNLHPWKIPNGTISSPQTGWDLTATPTMLYGGFGRGPNYLAAFRLDVGDLGLQAWRFNTVGNVQTVALSADGSRLFFGGHFGIARLRQSVCGGTNNLRGLASVNPTTGAIYCDWLPSIEGPDPNYAGPWALTATDAHLWVGGGFTGISGAEQRNLARFTL